MKWQQVRELFPDQFVLLPFVESETGFMKIAYNGQLLTTTITLCFRGNTLQIPDIIIDTGSSHAVFSPDALEDIGVTYENGDSVYEAYGIGGTVPFYTKIGYSRKARIYCGYGQARALHVLLCLNILVNGGLDDEGPQDVRKERTLAGIGAKLLPRAP
ncbi:MAG: hypothetical protein K0S25_1963 [Bacillus sp. (in: firmicutes)]|jgi:hypothetical protein|nr:hypothetical protein [Bacillus sp. (in: firmicutes)]